MHNTKAVVAKVEGRHMWVITEDRRVLQLPCPVVPPRPGQEIILSGQQVRATAKPTYYPKVLAAALVLFVLCAGVLYHSWTERNVVVAYIEISINPSLELAIDTTGRVREIRSLNDAADKVLSDLGLKRLLLEDALALVIGEIERQGYFGEQGLVMATLVELVAENDNLRGRTESALQSYSQTSKVVLDVVVQKASVDDRLNASAENKPTAVQYISQQAVGKNIPLSGRARDLSSLLQELRTANVTLEDVLSDKPPTKPPTVEPGNRKTPSARPVQPPGPPQDETPGAPVTPPENPPLPPQNPGQRPDGPQKPVQVPGPKEGDNGDEPAVVNPPQPVVSPPSNPTSPPPVTVPEPPATPGTPKPDITPNPQKPAFPNPGKPATPPGVSPP